MGRYCFCRTKTFKRKYNRVTKGEDDIVARSGIKTVPQVTYDDNDEVDLLEQFAELDDHDVIYTPNSPKKKLVQEEKLMAKEKSCDCQSRTLARNRIPIAKTNDPTKSRSKVFPRVTFTESKQKELLTKFQQLDVSDIKDQSLKKDKPRSLLMKRQLEEIKFLERIWEPSSKRVKRKDQ